MSTKVFAIVMLMLFVLATCEHLYRGMKCHRERRTKKLCCSGKNDFYLRGENQIKEMVDNDYHHTTDKQPEATDVFKYPNCSRCREFTVYGYRPTYMENEFGEERYVYQTDDFIQTVNMTFCAEVYECGYNFTSSCQQKHLPLYMVGWNPYNISLGLMTERYNIAVNCCCE